MTLRAKLKEKRGASALIGLVIFVVCAVLAAVIISASGTASGAVLGTGRSEQSYLLMCSAAGTVQEDLKDATFAFDGTDVTVASGYTGGIVKAAAKTVGNGMKNGTASETVTATCSPAGNAQAAFGFYADLTFDRDTLRLTVTLRPMDGAPEGSTTYTDAQKYRTTLTFDAARTVTGDGVTTLYYSEGILR